MDETDHFCAECNAAMVRDTRPMLLTYKGIDQTIEMPGWYCTTCKEAVYSSMDLEVSDRALRHAKELAEKRDSSHR